jgi:cell division GTPase FtsZ
LINIIGLGNCGNNILNTISKFKDKSINLISLQKDMQILLLSKSDINIEIKSGFTKQLDEILENSSKVFIIGASAGTTSNEYIPFLFDSLNSFQIEYKIILITPFSFENKGMKSDTLISKLEDKKNLIVFENNKITALKEEFEKMDKEIYQLILENI